MAHLRIQRAPSVSTGIVGVFATVSLALAACGSSETPTILDTEKVERAIEQQP